jgi:hypothetical protein
MFWNSGNGSNDIKVIKIAALTLMSSTTASWRICKKQRGKRLQMPCSHEHLQTFSERQTWGISHAKAQSNCRGAGFRMFGALRKRSWHGAMRSFFCMYKRGVFLWDTRDISVRPRHPVPLGEAIWLCYDMETQVVRWGNGQGIRIPCMF